MTTYRTKLGLFGAGAFALMTGGALAADLGSMKDEPMMESAPEYTIAVTGGLTTDYVFRGVSQSDNDPAVFITTDFTYNILYLGMFASSLNFDRTLPVDPTLEIDLYGGLKKTFNGVTFDVGFIYYLYPQGDADDTGNPGGFGLGDLDYIEAKFAVSGSLWTDSTISGTVYYSPDYTLETDEVITVEGKFSQGFTFGDFTFGFSGLVGAVNFEDDRGIDYVYWNAGIYKTFKNFTIDVRYHDTDLEDFDIVDLGGNDASDLADERVVGTISFAY